MNSNSHSGADSERNQSRPHTCIMTDTERPQDLCNFESVLLAIAGHDLRQSLQTIQCAHDLLGFGLRTRSELKHLRSSQAALDQLNDQLSQLMIALRIRLHAKELERRPVRVQQLLKQACQENDTAAQRKRISLRVVLSKALILSDSLLLGAALRNLVSNAIRYTHEGDA